MPTYIESATVLIDNREGKLQYYCWSWPPVPTLPSYKANYTKNSWHQVGQKHYSKQDAQ